MTSESEQAVNVPEAHTAGDLGFALPEPARLSRARGVVLTVGTVVVLAGAFAVAFVPLHRHRSALAAATHSASASLERVQVVTPQPVASARTLVLPGSVQALEETVVYARASGYVRKWHGDLGDKVREGDLLVEIDTPEIEQQIAQARAQLAQAEAGLAQARANATFSKSNAERYQKLTPSGITSQEELEKATAQAGVDAAAVLVASANAAAQRANLQRLAQLRSFAKVTAPFTGTITERHVERGALVTAGSASPLFKLSASDPVRVFVQVPQDVAPSVTVGGPATIKVREFPGRSFQGTIARSAGSLDAATRTMATEVRVPNPRGELMTCMYAEAQRTMAVPRRSFELPATALINDANGLRVAVVGPEGRLALLPVTIERDLGATIQIGSGLDGAERVVKLANAGLLQGSLVEVAP